MFAEWPARDINDGDLRKSAHSTGVSLDEAGMRWTFIPRQLPIHPTAIPLFILSRVATCFSYMNVQLNLTLDSYIGLIYIGVLGRNDRVWGGRGVDRLRGGSTVSQKINTKYFTRAGIRTRDRATCSRRR